MIPLPPGNLFPDMRFLHPIGGGSYGTVWLVQNAEGAFCAIKHIHAENAEHLARERQALATYQSLFQPGKTPPISLIAISEIREDASGIAYRMPLADSERPNWQADPSQYRPRTLRSDLIARRALPLNDCIAIGIRLAEALAFLEGYCLVHRDIKPSNVIYLAGRPVLADIGLLADTREAASIVGTPGYVPIEQHGRFSADIYSLGILLHELSTGRPAEELGISPVEEADMRNPLFPRWNQLLTRMLDRHAAKRPQTAESLLASLHELSNTTVKHRRIHWLWLLPGAALLLIVLARLHSPPTTQPTATTPPLPAQSAETTPAGTKSTLSPPASISASFDASASATLYPDRLLLTKGIASSSMKDWRVIFVAPAATPWIVIQQIGSFHPPAPDSNTKITSLGFSIDDLPDGEVPVPSHMIAALAGTPLLNGMEIYITTSQPAQWDAAVAAYAQEDSSMRSEIADRFLSHIEHNARETIQTLRDLTRQLESQHALPYTKTE